MSCKVQLYDTRAECLSAHLAHTPFCCLHFQINQRLVYLETFILHISHFQMLFSASTQLWLTPLGKGVTYLWNGVFQCCSMTYEWNSVFYFAFLSIDHAFTCRMGRQLFTFFVMSFHHSAIGFLNTNLDGTLIFESGSKTTNWFGATLVFFTRDWLRSANNWQACVSDRITWQTSVGGD